MHLGRLLGLRHVLALEIDALVELLIGHPHAVQRLLAVASRLGLGVHALVAD